MKTGLPRARTPKYVLLADDIADQVSQGVLRPGDRIPSVRQMSRERGVSITTVLEAYSLLEDRGVIRARPQSGYFVAWRPSVSARPQPTMSSASPWPAEVTISDLGANVLLESVSQGMVRFGAALPAAELLPTERLNRILGSLARRGEANRDLHASVEGLEELRRQIAQRRSMQGCALDSSALVVTSGCTESLSLALQVTTKTGDLVAVESPTYFGILQILEVLGLRALEIPTHPVTGMSLEALQFALLHDDVRAVVVMTNFSNPLGSSVPDAAKRRLVAMLAEKEIPLIEDDVDGELYFAGSRPTVCKCYDKKGLVLLCSSFSKDIAPTYRVGWIAPGRFLKPVKHVREALTGRAPLMTQMVLTEYLSHGGYEHHLRRLRRAYAARVDHMAQAVVDQFPEGTRVSTPSGGYVLWVEMPPRVDSLVLFRMALEAGISVVPGHLFSVGSHFTNCVRLNAAYWSKRTEPALSRLAEMAHQLADAGSSRPASRLP
ncbi:MAG: PLP-dependent aminotransferase family protein [Thermoleophilia bacterium]|nr:PLP-dependent aminotransferase family protein [Thermoleophilia bacterium]